MFNARVIYRACVYLYIGVEELVSRLRCSTFFSIFDY